MSQRNSVGFEQQHRDGHSLELRFNKPRQAVEHAFERGAGGDHLENLGLTVAQGFPQLSLGDVVGDADHADDFAGIAAHRNLGGQDPGLRAVRLEEILLHFNNCAARGDDVALVRVILLPGLRGTKLEIGLADGVAPRLQTHASRRRVVGEDEAALGVLDPQVVGNEVDKRLQRQPLALERTNGLMLGRVAACHPTAFGERKVLDLKGSPVRQSEIIFSRAGADREARAEGEVFVNRPCVKTEGYEFAEPRAINRCIGLNSKGLSELPVAE